MYVEYYIQPDDRNHLYVKEGENLLLTARVGARELKYLINGRFDFVEHGVWSDYAKELMKKIAQLFREGKIKYIVFRPYLGKKFEYMIEPENLEVIEEGAFAVKYKLHYEDKDVIIKPFHREPDPYTGYPFSIEVIEIKKPKPKTHREPETELDKLLEELKRIYRALTEIDEKKTKKAKLIGIIVGLKVILPKIIGELEQLKEREERKDG